MTDPETLGRRETDDDATLASFYYGSDALFGYYRKVVLAACAESIRASAAASGHKISESRCDDLAHVHTAYLSFLAHHLDGRREWMARYIKDGGMTK